MKVGRIDSSLTPIEILKSAKETIVSTAQKTMSFVKNHPRLICGILFISLIGVCSAYVPPKEDLIPFSSRENLQRCLKESFLSDPWIHEKGITDILADKFHSKAFSPEGFSLNLREIMNQIYKIHSIIPPLKLRIEQVLKGCSIDINAWALEMGRDDL